MEQLSETLIWGLFVFVAVFLVNFLWIFKRGYENIKKQKTKNKNNDSGEITKTVVREKQGKTKCKIDFFNLPEHVILIKSIKFFSRRFCYIPERKETL